MIVYANLPRPVRQLSGRRSLLGVIVLAAAIIFSASTVPAFAQYRTSIQGVVTDPQGAVVPGATLTLKNLSTNGTVVRTSDEAGVFNFNALPADHFSLTVVRAGFQKQVLDNLQLIPEQPNSLNVKLELGVESTTVNVDASLSQPWIPRPQAPDEQFQTTKSNICRSTNAT